MAEFELRITRTTTLVENATIKISAPKAGQAIAKARLLMDTSNSDTDLKKAGVIWGKAAQSGSQHEITAHDSKGRKIAVDQATIDTAYKAEVAAAEKAATDAAAAKKARSRKPSKKAA